MIFRIFFSLIIGCCIFNQSFAQAPFSRFLEVGTSANSYRGDLASAFNTWNAGVQLGLKLNFKKRFNGHVGLSYGTVSGSNANYYFQTPDTTQANPNIYFKTKYFSLNYDLQFNLYKNKNWIIYFSQGIGFMRFTPKDESNQSFVNQLGTRATGETFNQVVAIFPTHLGFYYILNNGYGFNFQTGFLNSQTDYIDNISTWGNRSKKDNILYCKFAFVIPLTPKK